MSAVCGTDSITEEGILFISSVVQVTLFHRADHVRPYPFRTKTSYETNHQGQNEKKTTYHVRIRGRAHGVRDFDMTLTSESLYLNHESGFSGRCRE